MRMEAGKSDIHTGLGFFDHMLDQIARHGKMDLKIGYRVIYILMNIIPSKIPASPWVKHLPKRWPIKGGWNDMDLLFPWTMPTPKCLLILVAETGSYGMLVFQREKIGDMPTEMFFHFFKSFLRCSTL